jgi:hypothetical protein
MHTGFCAKLKRLSRAGTVAFTVLGCTLTLDVYHLAWLQEIGREVGMRGLAATIASIPPSEMYSLCTVPVVRQF